MLQITYTGTNPKLEKALEEVVFSHGFTKGGSTFDFDSNESNLNYETPQTKPRIHNSQQTCVACEG